MPLFDDIFAQRFGLQPARERDSFFGALATAQASPRRPLSFGGRPPGIITNRPPLDPIARSLPATAGLPQRLETPAPIVPRVLEPAPALSDRAAPPAPVGPHAFDPEEINRVIMQFLLSYLPRVSATTPGTPAGPTFNDLNPAPFRGMPIVGGIT